MLLSITKTAVIVVAVVTCQAIYGTASDGDKPTQMKAGDSIAAIIIGKLSTVWDARTLFYASVTAGGTEIELDPAGCKRITAELLDYNGN